MRIIEFLERHVWPWTEFRRFRESLALADLKLTKAKVQINDLRFDLAQMAEFFANNGLSFSHTYTDSYRPLRLAYSLGNVKASVSRPGDNREGLMDVEYIYSDPQVIRIRTEMSPLSFKSPESEDTVMNFIRAAIVQHMSTTAEKVVKDLIIKNG